MQSSTSQKNKKVPSVKKYTSALKYIQDIYDYKKSLDPKLSLDLWSIQLGFKSRSFMNMVYNGQRAITLKTYEALSTSLKLSSSDKEYFYLLTQLSNAADPIQQKVYIDHILEKYEGNGVAIENKYYKDFLSSPAIPVMHMLLAFEDFTATVHELAELLALSKKDVNAHLNLLEKMNLAISVDGKYWKATNKSFVVTKEAKNEAINRYHHSTADEIKKIILKTDIQKRMRTILFSLPENAFPELLNEMELFLDRTKNKYGSNTLNNQKIIKLNMQAYEVTGTYKKK